MSAARDAASRYSARAAEFERAAAIASLERRTITSLVDRNLASVLRRASRAETWDPEPPAPPYRCAIPWLAEHD